MAAANPIAPENQYRADKNDAQIITESLCQRTQPVDLPHKVKRGFNFLDQGYDCIYQQGKTERAEHAHFYILHKPDDVLRDLGALRTQRRQQIEQQRLDLVVHSESLEHRKTDRQQRHYRQERGVNKTHGPQIQLTTHKLPEQHVHHTQAKNRQLAQAAKMTQIIIPDKAFYPAYLPEESLIHDCFPALVHIDAAAAAG